MDLVSEGDSHHLDRTVTTVSFRLEGSMDAKELDTFMQVGFLLFKGSGHYW